MQDVNFSQAQIKAIRRADVIFVAADGYTLAPSRIRAYTFAKACRERGLNAEVVSFYDHLGAPGQGSAAYRMDEQTKLRLIALGADILKLNPTAIFYMQKVSYHSLSVAIAAGANGNPVVLDYDDFDFHANFLPRMSRFLPGVRAAPADGGNGEELRTVRLFKPPADRDRQAVQRELRIHTDRHRPFGLRRGAEGSGAGGAAGR